MSTYVCVYMIIHVCMYIYIHTYMTYVHMTIDMHFSCFQINQAGPESQHPGTFSWQFTPVSSLCVLLSAVGPCFAMAAGTI